MSRNRLLDVIHSFKCDTDDSGAVRAAVSGAKITKPASPRKAPKPGLPRKDVQKETPENPVALRDLPPSICENLTVVFVGFNPGVESSKQQHHYAHPTNLFWKLFNQLRVLQAVCDARHENARALAEKLRLEKSLRGDVILDDILQDGDVVARPHHDYVLSEFGVGFTDLVLRCTKQAHELSRAEKLENVPRLFAEFKQSNAPFIVFIGKGIWETVGKFLAPSHKLTKETFSWGRQHNDPVTRRLHVHCGYEPTVYVFPNTSGLVTLLTFAEKLSLWEALVANISSRQKSD